MKKILFALIGTIFSIAILFSCKKTESLAPMQMFMPGTSISITPAPTNVTLSWTASINTDSSAKNIDYVIQVAKDSTFSNVVYTTTTKNFSVIITDTSLTPKVKYVARLQVKGVNGRPDSKWLVSNTFTIPGENLFITGAAKDIQYYTAILRWTHQDGLTKITVTKAGGTSYDSTVKADTILLTGLTPNTTYTAELFKGTVSKGTTTFTTKDAGIFTKIIDPTANLTDEINNAANGAVLGLMDGAYDLGVGSAGFAITAKNITIASVSGDPTAATLANSDFILKGAGAGIKLSGLGLTGPASGYIIDIDAAATNIGDITIENCKIAFPVTGGYAVLRANRGASAGSQSMGTFTINNTVGIGMTLNNNYGIAMMDKMKFTALVIKNSTFTGFQRNIISAATLISAWAPTVTIDRCTFNNFGGGGKAAVLDGTTNNIALSITNTIFANTPTSVVSGATVTNSAITAIGSSVLQKVFYYNCNNGATPSIAITWPTGAAATSDISAWTAATTSFTLPVGSALRTAATDNGAVGDPRWAQ